MLHRNFVRGNGDVRRPDSRGGDEKNVPRCAGAIGGTPAHFREKEEVSRGVRSIRLLCKQEVPGLRHSHICVTIYGTKATVTPGRSASARESPSCGRRRPSCTVAKAQDGARVCVPFGDGVFQVRLLLVTAIAASIALTQASLFRNSLRELDHWCARPPKFSNMSCRRVESAGHSAGRRWELQSLHGAGTTRRRRVGSNSAVYCLGVQPERPRQHRRQRVEPGVPAWLAERRRARGRLLHEHPRATTAGRGGGSSWAQDRRLRLQHGPSAHARGEQHGERLSHVRDDASCGLGIVEEHGGAVRTSVRGHDGIPQVTLLLHRTGAPERLCTTVAVLAWTCSSSTGLGRSSWSPRFPCCF
ncbi:hypothetical protein HPB51_026874 [Rhipicephalus microplus]|uniref:Uncharacterized protein n=1 Tax=Rhipicephalus microplus TaxID=6941 RepID=A0A9J6D1Y1_RHIMP|nr:hypothetical protein HPB51_026874 [Rhipicephalus microplus]